MEHGNSIGIKLRETASSMSQTRAFESKSTSPVPITSEKLKISFEKQLIRSQMQMVTNRINKILAGEKETTKKRRIEQCNAEIKAKKQERNAKKLNAIAELRYGKLQQTLESQEKVKIERNRRKSHIKELEEEIFVEKRNIAKEIRKRENEWKDIVKEQKNVHFEENMKKKQIVREMLMDKKHQRCVSQITVREKNRERYEKTIAQLKNEKEAEMKRLQELEIAYVEVLKKTQGLKK